MNSPSKKGGVRKQVQPILGVGCPRSGTTLMGKYIGSHPEVLHLGEYAGFYFGYHIAEWAYRRLPFLYKDQYLAKVKEQAEDFPFSLAVEHRKTWYYDSSPLNMIVMSNIVEQMPEAFFVLTVRHYTGVIQSLARSYRDGYEWAGSTWAERAKVWRDFYSNVVCLPLEKTLVLSYDRLCSTPEKTVGKLNSKLRAWGLDPAKLNLGVFENSHATDPGACRPTLRVRSEKKKGGFESIPSFNHESWTVEINAEVQPVVRETDQLMKDTFPKAYVDPRL